MIVRTAACVALVFACTPPQQTERAVSRLSACELDDECPEGQACLGGKCTVTCATDADCDGTQLCVDAQCAAKIPPTIAFSDTTIELFAGEPAIDVTPAVVLGPHDTSAALTWHEIVAPEGAVKIADFSGPTLHFAPVAVGHYAYEVIATHKGGSARDVLILHVSEDSLVGLLSRDNVSDGLYRLTTGGELTLLHTRADNERFEGYRALDNHRVIYAVQDTVRHDHYATAAFSPRYWSAAAPSGTTNDCASASNGYCCPAGMVIIDRDPSYFCCPSARPAGVDPSFCCPASYRVVTVSNGGNTYDLCCPDDGLNGYEHDQSQQIGGGDFGACVLRTNRNRLSLHQWSDRSSDNKAIAHLLASVGVGNVCESGIEPQQVTTAPSYECEWTTLGLAMHPSGEGFAVLLEARSVNGIQEPTNEIVLYVDPKTVTSPLVVTDGVIPAAKRLVHRKTAVPDASRYFKQIAFRPDGVLVLFAQGQNGATDRLLWFDPSTAASLGARDVARVGGGYPTMLPLASAVLLADATAMRVVPLTPNGTAEQALGAYAGSPSFPALDAATQAALASCSGACDPSVTTLPDYADVACTGCCACLRDNGATTNPLSACQAQTGVSYGSITTVAVAKDGSKALLARRVHEASPPSCVMFAEAPDRVVFETFDVATTTFATVPAPTGMKTTNLTFEEGNQVAAAGFAAQGRQTLISGPVSGDATHVNVWRRNQADGSTEALLPNDVTSVCGAAQTGYAWVVLAALIIRRAARRRASR